MSRAAAWPGLLRSSSARPGWMTWPAPTPGWRHSPRSPASRRRAMSARWCCSTMRRSAAGAAGAWLGRQLERCILARGGDRDAFLRALAGSVHVSADVTHATHPNYADRHEPEHQIALNGGPVVKVSANVAYGTDAPSHAAFLLAARQAGVPVQYFVNRSGVRSGGTIGPIVAAGLAVPTVDVGIPVLAMHSARELGGADDPAMLIAALTAFLAPA